MNTDECMTTQELREAVATLQANIIAMCNAKDMDSVCTNFISAKELLINIYKHNASRVSE